MSLDARQAGNFPATIREAWLELVEQTLGGKPFRALITTLGGIEIQPLYDSEGASEAEWPVSAQEGLAWQVLAPEGLDLLAELENGCTD